MLAATSSPPRVHWTQRLHNNCKCLGPNETVCIADAVWLVAPQRSPTIGVVFAVMVAVSLVVEVVAQGVAQVAAQGSQLRLSMQLQIEKLGMVERS